jgi:pimeloyl-ACP methyl ester carboxylesterase
MSTNGVGLHVAMAGPQGGPLAILLHGFPEPWLSWRQQIGPLAEAGHRVLAPDQRGYNTSDKPARVADYALDNLAADVVGLIDASGREQAALVGHDWGGIVAW